MLGRRLVGNVINVVVFIVKGWFLVFVMMWVRWTLPRLRIDQVMMTCLKYLLPISCVLLLGVSVLAGGWCPTSVLDLPEVRRSLVACVAGAGLRDLQGRDDAQPPAVRRAWRRSWKPAKVEFSRRRSRRRVRRSR